MYVVLNRFTKVKNPEEFLRETKAVWIRSYKSSKGFVKTMILQKKDEFVTIDLWKSKTAADAFFSKNLTNLEKLSHVPKIYKERKSYVMCQ